MQGEAKEEVRSRLNIEDVVGEYVELKRAGRNFKGLSPFTGEKTPSFFVSPDKQIWHDFSSNRGGDVFSFVMEVEGMDFRQALEHLARKAGVDLSLYKSGADRKIAERKRRSIEANKLAVRYYQKCLIQNKNALSYTVDKRGLNKKVIQDFQIGYAPNSKDALVKMLVGRGFSANEIADAGLVNRFGGDLFRGRMMVPLMDPSGEAIGFTGRILEDIENAPKYLNTPQTVLYDKSRHIFGFSQAKDSIRAKSFVVLVEGNMDVVTAHQYGAKNVVATAGTAMTEYHLKSLQRLTDDIRLCFDSDKAGIAATERAIGIASGLGIDLTIVVLPGEAKDPDELIKKDLDAWNVAVAAKKPAVEWVLEQYETVDDLSTAAGKRRFSSKALEFISRLHDEIEIEHYQQIVAQKTGTTVESIKHKSEKLNFKQDKSFKKINPQAMRKTDSPMFQHEDSLLALAISDLPSRELLAAMNAELFSDQNRKILADYLTKNREEAIIDTPKGLQDIDTYVKIVLLQADTRYADWSENDRYYETARMIRLMEHENLKQTQAKLIDRLREAEALDDDDLASKLREEINKLIKEIARGKRR